MILDLRSAAGASAVEYALLIAGVAVVIIAAVFAFGGSVSTMFHHSNDCIAAGAASTC